MKFFRYWATGTADVNTDDMPWSVRCHGGSNVSVEDAVQKAAEIAERAAAGLRTGTTPDFYAYADRPLREEVLEEFTNASDVFAVVTRNSYGSMILNCAQALFADIDYPRPSFLDALKRLFRRGSAQSEVDAAIIQRVNDITASAGDLGLRLYRTANGYRCLVTSRPYDPQSSEARELLIGLGSDPLYTKLCQSQQCFRARVSPKFWRCGATQPPTRIPWASDEQERDYRRWQSDYDQVSSRYGTCAFVGSFGSSLVHPAIQPVLSIHDELSCTDTLPLA